MSLFLKASGFPQPSNSFTNGVAAMPKHHLTVDSDGEEPGDKSKEDACFLCQIVVGVLTWWGHGFCRGCHNACRSWEAQAKKSAKQDDEEVPLIEEYADMIENRPDEWRDEVRIYIDPGSRATAIKSSRLQFEAQEFIRDFSICFRCARQSQSEERREK